MVHISIDHQNRGTVILIYTQRIGNSAFMKYAAYIEIFLENEIQFCMFVNSNMKQ